MRGSILKYFGEGGGDEHGGLLAWPGTIDGFPFRTDRAGAVPNLKQHEIENVPVSVDFHCKTFQLWVEEDYKEYVKIRDKAANNWYVIYFIDRNTDDHERVSVYLEWVQPYGETKNRGVPRQTEGVGHGWNDAVKNYIDEPKVASFAKPAQ